MDIGGPEFRDKVFGCWAGKNAGGTLGGPLEEAYGREDPFDVSWYPELREGGMPNDDLELQIIWLKAVEQIGPKLKAGDLAQYWLDNVGYNYDEYGLSKTNLRLGLRPPVSGAYNNWFRDCMGSPIRSEIWACLAPGRPNVSARMGFEDAICDHAGGESVLGEIFNAAFEAAAFVEGDIDTLLRIGLSFIPAQSKTAEAINAARDAHRDGRSWLEARARVLAVAPHYVAQYSPLNLGFDAIGLLYGRDFGDAICTAVNCGYDTDCTGGTVGAMLGIIYGRGGLPERWMEPLGNIITTSEPSGGIRNLDDESFTAPRDLEELTRRVAAAAQDVLAAYPVDRYPFTLTPDDGIEALWTANPYEVSFRGPVIDVAIDYKGSPTIIPGLERDIDVGLSNRRSVPIRIALHASTPTHWMTRDVPADVELGPHQRKVATLRVLAPHASDVENSNQVHLHADVVGRPAEAPTPIVMVGAAQYRWTGPLPLDGATSDSVARVYDLEHVPGPVLEPTARDGDWQTVYGSGYALPLNELPAVPGVYFLQTFLSLRDERPVWIGLSLNCPYKLWLHGEELASRVEPGRARPNYQGQGQEYVRSRLAPGWNEVLIKLVRVADAPALEAYLMLSDPDDQYAGIPDVGRTSTPWDGHES